jgi:hypothetical protein
VELKTLLLCIEYFAKGFSSSLYKSKSKSVIERTMNQTVDILSIPSICDICQTSHGFSSADQRSIIVMVVLTGIALILCYIGVLWYAIRTRFTPDEKLLIIVEDIHTNEAFSNDEKQDGDIEENVQNMVDTTTIQPTVFTVENEKERY